MTSVTVHQLKQKHSGKNDAFMNVDVGGFHVRVWTSNYSHPTYLIQYGIQVELIQFDDQESANEWLKERNKIFKENEVVNVRITKLDDKY